MLIITIGAYDEKEEGGKTWGIERRWTEWNEKTGTGRRTGGRG